MIVSFPNPKAVELSVWSGEGSWGHPISVRVWRRGTISRAVWYRAASSASAAEATTCLITCDKLKIGPLGRGMGSLSLRKMWAPARLRAPVSVRKLASECAARTMVIGVGGNIVEQLMNSGCRGCGGRGLLGADGAERGKQFVVDGPGIVEKGTDDTLNAFNVLRREYGFIGADWCHLLMGAICDGDVRMWCMLGFGRLGVCIFKE